MLTPVQLGCCSWSRCLQQGLGKAPLGIIFSTIRRQRSLRVGSPPSHPGGSRGEASAPGRCGSERPGAQAHLDGLVAVVGTAPFLRTLSPVGSWM